MEDQDYVPKFFCASLQANLLAFIHAYATESISTVPNRMITVSNRMVTVSMGSASGAAQQREAAKFTVVSINIHLKYIWVLLFIF